MKQSPIVLSALIPGLLVLAACGGRSRTVPVGASLAPAASSATAEARLDTASAEPAAAPAAPADSAAPSNALNGVLDSGDLIEVARQSTRNSHIRIQHAVPDSIIESCGELSGLNAPIEIVQSLSSNFIYTSSAANRVTFADALQKLSIVQGGLRSLGVEVCGTRRVNATAFRLVDGTPTQNSLSLTALSGILVNLGTGEHPLVPVAFNGAPAEHIKLILSSVLPQVRASLDSAVAQVQEKHRRNGDVQISRDALPGDIKECSAAVRAESSLRAMIGLLSDGRGEEVLTSDIDPEGLPLDHFTAIPRDSLLAQVTPEMSGLIHGLITDVRVKVRSAACRGVRSAVGGTDAALDYRSGLEKLSALDTIVGAL